MGVGHYRTVEHGLWVSLLRGGFGFPLGGGGYTSKFRLSYEPALV